MLKWLCFIHKISHTYVVIMGDPKLSMFSSYLSVLANKIYLGVGLEPGQMMMYVCICVRCLGVQFVVACSKGLVMP